MKKKKLIHKIFPSYLIIIVISLFAISSLAVYKVRSFYLKQTNDNLLSIARIVDAHVKMEFDAENLEKLDLICKTLGEKSFLRITLVELDGVVLGDTEENPVNMENHADRPEVIQAISQGVGVSTRFSPTLRKHMMYIAVPHFQNNQLVGTVRVSVPIVELRDAFKSVYLWMLGIGLLIVLLSAVISYIIAKRITSPLEKMKVSAVKFAQGDFSQRITVPDSVELASLANTLNSTAVQLQKRIEIISNQRNEQDAVLSSMVEGVIAFDTHERVININPAAAKILNLEYEKVNNRLLEEVIRNPELRNYAREIFNEKKSREKEISINDGQLILQTHGTILYDATGEEMGFLLVMHDITAIRELDTVRKDFAANVSHEIRTPITAIKGFVETLMDGAVNDPETAREFLEITDRHINRLNDLIDDLLTLSRIQELGEVESIKVARKNLNEAVNSALNDCKHEADDKNIELVLEAGEQFEADINSELLERAVSNLINNAIHYSPENEKVIITLSGTDNEILISVKDNGCGIEEKHLQRIFERFYRVDKNRSRQLGGTGLGLSIVKHIVKAHNGRIEVKSVIGKGSTFTIYLPSGK